MIKKIIIIVVFLLGLGYLLWPGQISINSFPDQPQSLKSDEPYDTYLLPNTKAFFSDTRRREIVPFYKESMQKLYCLDNSFKFINPFCYIEPLRLNRPYEEADGYIRDQILVTYLEEYTYPMKGSLFINGYEPFDESGKQFNFRSAPIEINGQPFTTKTTLRWFEPNLLWSVFVYIGIWLSAIWLIKLVKKILTK